MKSNTTLDMMCWYYNLHFNSFPQYVQEIMDNYYKACHGQPHRRKPYDGERVCSIYIMRAKCQAKT